MLTDQSTNGTFVQTEDGQEVFIRREELALYGNGYISLGKQIDRTDIELIHYSND